MMRWLAIVPLAAAAPAGAQAGAAVPDGQTAAAPAPAPAPSGGGQDDIVITGYRDRKPPETRAVVPTTVNVLSSRRQYEFSERVAQCATRGHLSGPDLLRAVVDGDVYGARARFAQERIVRLTLSCNVSGAMRGLTNLDELNYFANRDALTIAVLKRYAPDLTLTRDQTEDPAVQRRLYRREVPRNRLRLPADHQFLRAALCTVRMEPGLAVRLALSDGPARLSDLQEVLIDRTRICLGSPKRVVVDPTQFRLFIADAVYRWTVAARGVETLIPSG